MDPLASLKRKNADKLNFDLCVLCQDIKKVKRTSRCEPLRSTPDGISRVRDTAVERKELGEHSELLNTLDKVTDSDWASGKIVYHNSCYSSFTSRSKVNRLIKKNAKDSNVAEIKEGNRRVSMRKSQCVNWKRCVFCQTGSENDDNIRHVETLQLSERILSKSKHDLVLCAKLAGVTQFTIPGLEELTRLWHWKFLTGLRKTTTSSFQMGYAHIHLDTLC